MNIEELLEQIEKAKEYCKAHNIDWDAIKTDFVPKVMTYLHPG